MTLKEPNEVFQLTEAERAKIAQLIEQLKREAGLVEVSAQAEIKIPK